MDRNARINGIDFLIFGIAGGFVGWFLYRAHIESHYTWSWHVIPQYFFRFDAQAGAWMPGVLMQGIITTLRISFWATFFALAIGTVMALIRTGTNRFLRMAGTGYVALIRNIPVLVWVFIAYYFIGDTVIPALGLERVYDVKDQAFRPMAEFLFGPRSQLTVFTAGTAALAAYEGAYVTEIIRAGIQSIDTGQWEASMALGFTRLQQMKHIILPQALKNVLPPLAGQIISTIKDSSIVSVISIQELTFQGMELMSATFLTFEIWITIMGIYFILCFCCSLGVEQIERSLKRPRSLAGL